MGSFSGLGIGLSFGFGFILLALVGVVAELSYLLWWRQRRISGETNHLNHLSYLFCWKKERPTSLDITKTQEPLNSATNPDAYALNAHEPDLELGDSDKDLLRKSFEDEGVESELMRLHNLSGPPRFLFTINEESKEDLESDDGRSRGGGSRKGSRTRSLSDLLLAAENPILTPLASPKLKAKNNALESYNHRGFNPLFESVTEAELNMFRSSPPPKLKFLRDAEEKLMRRLMEEVERRRGFSHGGDSVLRDSDVKSQIGSMAAIEEREGSFIRFIVGKKNEREGGHQELPLPQYHSTASASQVLPLDSSPSKFRPFDNNCIKQ
ncbi:hypothetical protein U1Q18_033301 [Sarracenia purpurea var. burkii]